VLVCSPPAVERSEADEGDVIGGTRRFATPLIMISTRTDINVLGKLSLTEMTFDREYSA
jgi:hypothetical protein